MKKSLALLSTAALTLGLLSGCGGTQSGTADAPAADKGVVNVYNWGVYIDESVLEDFTAETGIKVVYDTFESNEAMYGVLKNEGASYDVVIPSDYMISRMIEEDMLEPLNFDNIPNFEDVDPALKNPDYDPENLYSVPYMWGLLGIIYNTSMVEETPTSWDIMFDKKLFVIFTKSPLGLRSCGSLRVYLLLMMRDTYISMRQTYKKCSGYACFYLLARLL